MSGSTQNTYDLFNDTPQKSAENTLGEFRTIAQKGVRNSEIALKGKGIAQGRANRPHCIRSNCAARTSPSLFQPDGDHLRDLELELRQTKEVIAEKSTEQVGLRAIVAPWETLWSEAISFNNRMMEEDQGFKVGGRQSRARLNYARQLDDLRTQFRNEYREIGRLTNEIRSLKNQARGLETEIKIVTAKMKRKAK